MAQTYKNGRTYYREHKASRGHGLCPVGGGSLPCYVADEQIGKIVESIELGPQWLEEVLTIVSLKDEVVRVSEQRQKVHEKLRRPTSMVSSPTKNTIGRRDRQSLNLNRW